MNIRWVSLEKSARMVAAHLFALNLVFLPVSMALAAQHGEHRSSTTSTDGDTVSIPSNYTIEVDASARRSLLTAFRPSDSSLPSQDSRANTPTPMPLHQVRLGAQYVEANIRPLMTASARGHTAGLSVVSTLSMGLPGGRRIERVQQYFRGREVFQNQVTVLYDRTDKALMSSGSVSKAKPVDPAALDGQRGGADQMTAAIEAAYMDLSGTKSSPKLGAPKSRGAYTLFATTGAGLPYSVNGDARAKPIWYALDDALIPAYYIEIQITPADTGVFLGFAYVIEQKSQKILMRANQTANESSHGYRGFFKDASAGTPAQGPHGDVVPKLEQTQPDIRELDEQVIANVSSWAGAQISDPWLTSDTSAAILQEFYDITDSPSTRTAGNNVIAYADRVAPDGFNEGDFLPAADDVGNFDYLLDRSLEDTSDQNAGAAAVNMFVVNNYLHDWWYQLKLFDAEESIGFNEQFGNAQFSNYGRGGEENDPLKAEAQDYGGINNANMFTPADGSSPRMQQYLWTGKWRNGTDYGVKIMSPLISEYFETVGIASFGPSDFDLTNAEVLLVSDTVDPPDDGCEPLEPEVSLSEKIVLLSRGNCGFTEKVMNAQNAGAAGVLIFNNVDDGTASPMGGFDPNVTIPSMGLTFVDGTTLRVLIEGGASPTVRMFLIGSMNDSSFDNGIVAHEWGHYMQNRMIGNGAGLINFQGRAMGEGWADFHSMMFLVEASQRSIQSNESFDKPYSTGTYVTDFYDGIRRAPYTPNMSINPLTFAHIVAGAEPPGLNPTNNASPHAAGEVWGAVLWDVYVNLLNRYDFEEAQNRMALYLFAGYAFTPIAPTYTEARDAMLYFMLSWDEEDYEAAVSVFARRGLGFGASSPPRYSNLNPGTEVIESYSEDAAAATVISAEFVQNLFLADTDQCTANGILDAGETGFIRVSVQNTGGKTLDALRATVTPQSESQVSFPEGNVVELPSIPLFGSAEALLPVRLLDDNVGASLTLSISVSGEGTSGQSIQVSNASTVISLITNFAGTLRDPTNGLDTADIETLAWQFDLSPAFHFPLTADQTISSTPRQDTDNTDFFAGFNPDVDFGSAMLRLPDTGFSNDYSVETVPFLVSETDPLLVSFWHFYWIEQDWDGGVIEISVDGGDWQDVTEAGGIFSVGYAGPLNFLLPGRDTFTGINGDFATSMGGPEQVAFGTSLAGSIVKLRFRMVSDEVVGDYGWAIDNLTISGTASPIFHDLIAGSAVPCDNLPSVTVPPAQPVIVRFDYERNQISLYMAPDQTGSVTSYIATCTETDNPLVTVSSVSQTSTVVVGGLKDNVAYICRARASNAAGTGSASASTVPITPEALPAGLPVWLLYEAQR